MSLVGCLDRVPTVGQTTLGWFGIYNQDETSGYQFDVRIERDETTVHESSHRLEAYDRDQFDRSPPHSVVSCTWENIRGDYTVFIQSNSHDRHEFGVLDGVVDAPDCVIAYVRCGDDVGPSDDPPELSLVIDETDCSEVRSLPGGCAAYE